MENKQMQVLDNIVMLAQKYPQIWKVVLFGSRARGEQKERSDIDLAIYIKDVDYVWGHFCTDVEEINTLLKFDLVKVNQNTDEKLMQNIEMEGVILWEAQK